MKQRPRINRATSYLLGYNNIHLKGALDGAVLRHGKGPHDSRGPQIKKTRKIDVCVTQGLQCCKDDTGSRPDVAQDFREEKGGKPLAKSRQGHEVRAGVTKTTSSKMKIRP